MPQDTPLTSCLLPTGDNTAAAARAVFCFQQQTWPNKELVVIDYSKESITPLLDDLKDQELRYIRFQDISNMTPGTLWNKALEQASGEFIIHWEPENWYHPNRIQHQIEPLLDNYQCSRVQGTLIHLDHPEYVHHPYIDLHSDGYAGSVMYRKREGIRFPDKKEKMDRFLLSLWDKEEVSLIKPDLSWLIIRSVHGDRRTREFKKFVSGYRNSTKDLAWMLWGKLRGRDMVSHPRFRLSPQARESFSQYLRDSKKMGLITSVS